MPKRARHSRPRSDLLASSGRPPTRSLRLAAAQLRLHTGDAEAAIEIADAVLADAEEGADRPATIAALNTLGAARMVCEDTDDGIVDLERGLVLAEAAGAHLQVAMLLANLGGGCATALRLDVAERALSRGIALCRDRDLDAPRLHQTASLAVVRTLQGRWDDAVALATEVVESPGATTIARVKAHATLGRVRARRGGGDPWPSFEAAHRLAGDAAATVAALAVLRAEAAWLEGRLDAVAREAARAASMRPAMAAELGVWRRLGGVDPPDGLDPAATHPCALEAVGEWRRAAEAWQALGCPFETARALSAGDEPAQRDALVLCERLGARSLADRIRRALRSAGARAVSRGPRAATLDQVAGLTQVEATVLTLLASGLRNKEIALRLSRSPRTIDHHLENVYAKLNVINAPQRRRLTTLALAALGRSREGELAAIKENSFVAAVRRPLGLPGMVRTARKHLRSCDTEVEPFSGQVGDGDRHLPPHARIGPVASCDLVGPCAVRQNDPGLAGRTVKGRKTQDPMTVKIGCALRVQRRRQTDGEDHGCQPERSHR